MPISLVISSSASSLGAGQTAGITFTFSEQPLDFTIGDVSVAGGTLSGFTGSGVVYTATFTPNSGVNAGAGSLSVAAGSYSNVGGDLGGAASSGLISYDTAAPTASIMSSASVLRSGETATITLTFSEAVTGLTLSDLSSVGGTLSSLTGAADPRVYTVDFTPNAGLSGFLGSVSLTAGSYADVAGNNGAGASSAAMTLNTTGPSVVVATSQAVLKAGETADITFTFSDSDSFAAPPVGFTASDIVVSGGVLSGLSNLGNGVYRALFTPAPNVDAGVAAISVTSGSYTDSSGAAGGGASVSPISFDTRAPTISISSSASTLKAGESAIITFTFSEAPSGFSAADLSVSNGAISEFSATSNPLVYTAKFVPDAGSGFTGGVSVAGGAYADLAGNFGQGGASAPILIDTVGPTVVVSSSHATVKAGETATISFTFSEAPMGFGVEDVSVTGGTISPIQVTGNPLTYTASFTPSEGVASGSASVSVTPGGYTDAAGNAGAGGSTPSLTIQTLRPAASIDITDTALSLGETTTVKFTFTEAVTGFTTADLRVENGAVSGLSTGDGGVTWTATLTPDVGISDASNLIVLDMTGVTNISGNSGAGEVNSTTYAIDSVRPTATITLANPALQAGQTSKVTIAFSEAVTGLTTGDFTPDNGVLSGLSSSDGGRTWTATFTPTSGLVDPTNVITLDLSGVTDLAGNTGEGDAISANYQVGYVPPPQPPSEDDVLVLPPGGGEVAAGPGNDSVGGGTGADVIQGNTGDDTLIGGGGDDIVRGGQDNDFVHGNVGADLLFGDQGNDSVFGGQGDDIVQGGAGNDLVAGDLGHDTLLGGQGADTVFGGAGNDYLSGDLGDDVLLGGAGADLFNFVGGGGRDVVMDFSHAEGDRIRIAVADAADYAALSTKFVADAAGTVIQLGGQTILLAGVAPGSLSAADFVFG